MNTSSIVDTRLYISLGLRPSLINNSLFLVDLRSKSHLASQLLIYDDIIIPTKDFGIIPALVNWMGLNAFREAIKKGIISFLHRKDMLAYVGNGNGISQITLSETEKKKFSWWQKALFGEKEEAIDLQLKYRCGFLDKKERNIIIGDVSDKCSSLKFEKDDFNEKIIHETYTDILKSEALSSIVLSLSTQEQEAIDLDRLPEVKANQVRVFDVWQMRDTVDLVLKIAEINITLYMGLFLRESDLLMPAGVEPILKDKLVRDGLKVNNIDDFASLLELNNLPDLRVAMESELLTFSEIWKLRKKGNAKRFRRWIKKGSPKDARELEKMYVDNLKGKAFVNALPLRAIKFLVAAGVGLYDPSAGLTASAIDSFFVDKLVKGYNPRLFIDEIGKLIKKN